MKSVDENFVFTMLTIKKNIYRIFSLIPAISFLAAILLLPFRALAKSVDLEPITIEKEYSGRLVDAKENISSQDKPYGSIEETIGYSSGVELRRRSGFGIQQDVSLRGATFEDADVQLAGVKINDPQTGHFSLEIPFTEADIDRAQIFKNSQSINFIPKAPRDRGSLLKVGFGEHALWEKLFSTNFVFKNIKNRLSIEHKISSGARPDTDFETYNFSCHDFWRGSDNDKEVEFLFGSSVRDFGADSFYSSLSRYRQEEEHTRQKFFLLRGLKKFNDFEINNNLYLRHHKDKFILDRHDPFSPTNYHTTYVYGDNLELKSENGLFAGSAIEQERINSTNLKKHSREKYGGQFGLRDKKFGQIGLSVFGGLDYFQKRHFLENGHFALNYDAAQNLKLAFNFDRIWRPPSFTELYYSDPSNRGRDDLKIQKSNNFQWGFAYAFTKNANISADTFLRKQFNTVDWGKDSLTAVWQAANVGDVSVSGFDVSIDAAIGKILNKISFGYTYQDLSKESPYNFSKYVFDYLRHKFVGALDFDLKLFNLNFISNFSKPAGRSSYETFDLKLTREMKQFTLAIEGTNIFNKKYQEIQDIDAAGRWYKLSVAYNF